MKTTREIIVDESKLVNRSDEVNVLKDNREIRDIIIELKSLIRKNNLKALSAPAIGYDKRIFCINFQDNEIKTFINPIITNSKGLTLSKETCTSLPNRTFIRPRNNEIEVMYETIQSKVESRKLIGLAAIVFQHEVDHLDSVLLSDIGMEIDEDFEEASEEERQEIINMYLDSIDMKKSSIVNEIQDNPEEKELLDGIKFMQGIANGSIEVEQPVGVKK